MKKTHIKIPHKCGSTIMNTIFRYGSGICSNTYRDLDHVNNSHHHESSVQETTFTRYITDIDQSYAWDSINNDNHLFVVRHPLSRLISAYYSYGWTHETRAAWVQDEEERKIVSDSMIYQREIIQKTDLDDYIIDNIDSPIDSFIWKCIQKDTTTCTCILPYEMFVTDPQQFITTSLNFLSMSDVVEDVIDKFRDQLSPVDDKTDDIVNNNLKTHRRTSNIHEWRTKIDTDHINKETKNKHVDKFDQYADFLTSNGIQ